MLYSHSLKNLSRLLTIDKQDMENDLSILSGSDAQNTPVVVSGSKVTQGFCASHLSTYPRYLQSIMFSIVIIALIDVIKLS